MCLEVHVKNVEKAEADSSTSVIFLAYCGVRKSNGFSLNFYIGQTTGLFLAKFSSRAWRGAFREMIVTSAEITQASCSK